MLFDAIRNEWGGPVGIEERAPSLANDPHFREWWATYLRMGASPGAAIALTRMNTDTDIRHVLPLVRVPSLVLHRSGDRCVRVEEGRYLASRIPGAQFVEVPGNDHLPFVGDQDSTLWRIEEFMKGLPGTPQTAGILATVLAASFDDDPEVEAQIRSEIERFGTYTTEYSWPAVTAAFHGPVRALQCAGALRKTSLTARIALHTGELVSRPGALLEGSAVSVARRVLERGAPNQVLATGTLRDLVAGSGIQFTARGRIEVPGIGEWQLLEAHVSATGS
jgi:hypothetical protein